jgi:hypothetical protein
MQITVLQSVSWLQGLRGVALSMLGTWSTCPYPSYVAMCCVKDLDDIKSNLTAEDVNHALSVYQDICELDLAEFVGRRLKISGEKRCDQGRLIYGFHELADALAWAMRAQHSILTARWPQCLESVHNAKTIYCCDKDKHWQVLFRGLRIAIAVNRQVLKVETVTVRQHHC